MHTTRLRRSLLYTPGSDEHKCRKALTLATDGVIFDLEDAVGPDRKEAARHIVRGLLEECRDAGKEILVRVNQISTGLGVADLIAVAPLRPHTIIVPKACPRDIVAADVIISGLEEDCGLEPGTIGLIPLVETAVGVETLREIIESARRITGLQLGAEDLTKELGIRRTARGEEIAYARNRLVMAARAGEVDAIDTPYADYQDDAGLADDLAYAKSIGMTAKTAIHPRQLASVNAAFSPTDAEVAEATAILDAYDESIRLGRGACSLNGKMIDAPVAERARKVVRKAGLISKAGVS